MIFLFLILALILRLVNLNQSLWLDEAVQAITATKSFSFIFEEIKGDFHPPLYHFLMHFWVRVFGNSEISLRTPSVFFGVATVYFVYKIVEFIDLKSFKFLPALILATSQFHIYYSQEARMYALSCFLATFTMYWWLKIVKSITKDKKVYPQFKLAYLICALFLIYTDYYGIMVVISQIIGGLIIFRKNLKNFINELLSVYLLIFIFYLPWAPMLFWLKTEFKHSRRTSLRL